MDQIPADADDYIRDSIDNSLGLPVSADCLRRKLLASEDHRHLLQDQIFVLQQRFNENDKRINLYKTEASLSAQGLRRCVEEKEALAAEYTELTQHCSKLERECALYEQDLERLMESCDDLAKENDELHERLRDNPSVTSLVVEVESLQKDKENLRINLHRAEEEVKVLFEENKLLDEENKRLLKQLRKERHHQGSESKDSAGSSTKGKRKTRTREGSFTESPIDSLRLPLSPLLQNSPDSRVAKK